MFAIELSEEAQQFLKKLDKHIKNRVETRLRRLQDNPIPSDARFIGRQKGEKIFRYRIGMYRVLYEVIENEKIVLVLRIQKRSKVYQ